MIIKMPIEEVVKAFVETLLPRFSDKKKLLQISLDVTAGKPEHSAKQVRYFVHLLFHRPDNYTKVMWKITGNPREAYNDFTVWVVQSDHDSCWKSDGLSTPMFNLGYKMVKELDPEARPIDCEVLAQFGLLSKPEIVTIKDYNKYNQETRTFTILWK